VVLALLLAGLLARPGAAQPAPISTERALAIGISQLDEGDVEAALITLTSLVEGLQAEGASDRETAAARAYLGLAHLQSNRVEQAVAEIQRACRDDAGLSLSPDRFPPLLLERCQEARRAAAPSPPPRPVVEEPVREPPARETPARTAGGRKLWPILLGAGAAAGVAVAVASAGGGTAAPPTTAPPTEQRVMAVTTITQATDDGYICERPPCNPALTEYAIARARFEFNPMPQGTREGADLAVDVELAMSSPTRLRVSPQDGCAPNAQLYIELEEPSGAHYEFAEQPFLSLSDPVYQAEQRLRPSYPFGQSGPFVPGPWELTLTFKHYPNGSFTTCEGTIQLNAATLEVLVRN
jgi:hypothetical protein